MTFDASLKVKRAGGHTNGLLRHIARDADEAAGYAFAHANPNIDPDLTRVNETFVNDRDGGFRKLLSIDGRPPSDELSDYLDARLATVRGPLRKDAVVLRPLILQLDPKWFDDHNRDWRVNGLNAEARRYTAESLKWAIEEFGQDNIVGGSLHCDEVNPQLHVLVIPMTSDGRLSQKDFFKGPGDLRRQHKQLRDQMEAVGYDVEHKVTARSRERLSSAEFQTTADRAKKAAARLAIATRDGEKAWEDRQSAKAELASARADADAIRRQAEVEGHKKGFDEGERLGFETGAKTASQSIEVRVSAEVAHALQRLRAELERLELKRADLQRRRIAFEEGLAVVTQRATHMDALIDEILQGTRFADPSMTERINTMRLTDRSREKLFFDRYPELRPAKGTVDAIQDDEERQLGD